MKLTDIQKIVAQGEGTTLEFKKSTGQLERGMETVCAFLNRNGGTLLFGITDKGDIVGQEVADSTKQCIAECIAKIHPSISPTIEYIGLPNTSKFVIAIKVDSFVGNKPFYYKHTPFFRIESTTIRMPEDIFEEMVMNKGGKTYTWESLPAGDSSISDIDEKLVFGAAQLGISRNRLPENVATQSIEEILKGLNLYTNNGQLTNAAMVLFGRNLMPRYSQCLLRMAKFKGTRITDNFIDNRQVHGNIFEIFEAAMSFFVKHLNISGGVNVNTWQRDDELDVPRIALRESIINACAHRLYHRAGSSISIAIFDDRIEVCNTGTFPIGITENNILTHDRSEPLNPIIANVLYKTTYLEQWGRGIRLIHGACVAKGLKAPSFTTDGYTVTVTFFLANEDNNVTINNQNVTINNQNVTEKDPNVTEKDPNVTVGEDIATRKSLRLDKILFQIKEHPDITTGQLALLLSVSRRTILRDLEYLKETGVISRRGSNKAGVWSLN